jgi:tripartite-type tricarboxylate transporter receptor subunit TctC
MENMDRRFFLALTAATFEASKYSIAQAYPVRPIRILQGFAPGGNADAIARLIGGEMSKTMGQPFIVEAQPGAGGTIAANSVARSKADGYTLLLATGGHVVAGALYNSLPYQTVNSFEMVSTITDFFFLIVTQANSNFRNFNDVLTASRSSPLAVTYGTAGIGSTHHLAGELLVKMAGVDMLHVPYRGDAAALSSLLAGDVSIIIAPPSSVLSNIKAGNLRALAITSSQRWQAMPKVPTVSEQGVPGYDVRSWAGLMAPAGTPKVVIERLNFELINTLQIPSIKTRLEELGGQVRVSSPDEMRTMVASELIRWQQVVADAKIPLQ